MKNNIRYINNTSFSCDPIKTSSDGTLLERTSSEIFVMLVVHSVLHLHCAVVLSLFPGNFAMLPVVHAGFSGPWRPPPALSSALATFDCLCLHLPQALRFWAGIFYPQAFFYLTLLPPHFWLNLRLSRPPWQPAVLPWCFQGFMLILETQTRFICLFDLQQSTIFIFRRICF